MKLIFGFFTLLALGVFDVTVANSSKIDAVLSKSLQRNGGARILVSMKEGVEGILDELYTKTYSSRTERAQAVYDAFTSRAQKSQSKVLRLLSTPSISQKYNFVNVRSLWSTNQIAIEFASAEFIDYLATMGEVSKISESVRVQLNQPIEHQVADDPPAAITANQWGIDRIGAPEVWKSCNGAGVVVGSIDTGCRGTHESLRSNFANDGHAWIDVLYGTLVPTDNHGHGTHTIGTMCGQNGYGVAPGAKWKSCKGLDNSGSGYSDVLLYCGEWMVCPTSPYGTNPDCSKGVDVVNNSWSSAGEGDTFYNIVVAIWHFVGIIPVFANGNEGGNCGSGTSPGDGNVIAVGATALDNTLASFSSVGPSFDGNIKPDIVAPGVNVTSLGTRSDVATLAMSGTSMAAPHVAGSIALILCGNNRLTYRQIVEIIYKTADTKMTSSNKTCGGRPDNVFPNYHFGHGLINVHAAHEAAERT